MSSKNVSSKWVGGNLVFYDKSGNVIATFDGVASRLVPKNAGGSFTTRFHVAIADINAGLTLLPALVGYKYRLLDAFAIAVGGAAGAVTTVDIQGTQAASVVKLVALGQAALTQSAVVRAGGSGGTVLADGASFAINDANTAIAIGKTGSALTTSTFIDVTLTYTIET